MTNTTTRELIQGSNFAIVKQDSITFEKPTDILIVDPCYICKKPKSFWSKFCDKMFSQQGRNLGVDEIGLLEFKGANILYSSTAYGDGVYPVSTSFKKEGDECAVDAGMLCVLSLEDAKKIGANEEDWDELGVIVREYVGTIEADGNGNFNGDNIFVDTQGLKSDNEEEE